MSQVPPFLPTGGKEVQMTVPTLISHSLDSGAKKNYSKTEPMGGKMGSGLLPPQLIHNLTKSKC